jgi:stalled ribosome alternative rescue factor ArfA
MKKKNPVAKLLRTSLFKKRIVKPKKGKGSFKRKKNIHNLNKIYN